MSILNSAVYGPREGAAVPALVTLGETMCAFESEHIGPLRHTRSVRLAVGGAEANVAIGARRLGVPTACIGRVGADPLGDLILRELRAEGVDVTSLHIDKGAPTGIMIKERRTANVSRVVYMRAQSAGSRLCPQDVSAELVEGAQILHVSGITLALSASARAAAYTAVDLARKAGVRVSFDLNYRLGLWEPDVAAEEFRSMIRLADIAFASHDEAKMLTGDFDAPNCAVALSDLGPKQVVIKQGELGYSAIIDGSEYAGRAEVVPVVDPVGAGDAFVAGYLASTIRGEVPATALHVANVLGAFAVSSSGDWEGAPTLEELPLIDARVPTVFR